MNTNSDPAQRPAVIDGLYDIFSRRTNRQNNFYWGLLREIERQTGTRAQDLHGSFKARFLVPCGIRSTANLTREGFGGYLDNIARWVELEYGINLNIAAYDPALGSQVAS